MPAFDSEASEKLMDETSWQILAHLQEDARMSFAELGRRVGLSAPAVMERVRKLEDAGIIKGYRAELDLRKLGFGIQAVTHIDLPSRDEERFARYVQTLPEVLQCHHILGDHGFMMHLAVQSVEHLERIIQLLGNFGNTSTTIILSSPVVNRVVERPGGAVNHLAAD